MKLLITAVFTVVLITGIPSCKPDCHVQPFFNIQSISIQNTTADTIGNLTIINTADTVFITDYRIRTTYRILFHSENQNAPALFGTPTTWATDCVPNGSMGSPEGLDSIFVITDKDYDSNFSKKDTINSIVRVFTPGNTTETTINNFITNNRDVISSQDGPVFKLVSKPANLAVPYTFTIVIKLRNGEVYQNKTQDVFFR